jgi:hypothetical protein
MQQFLPQLLLLLPRSSTPTMSPLLWPWMQLRVLLRSLALRSLLLLLRLLRVLRLLRLLLLHGSHLLRPPLSRPRLPRAALAITCSVSSITCLLPNARFALFNVWLSLFARGCFPQKGPC